MYVNGREKKLKKRTESTQNYSSMMYFGLDVPPLFYSSKLSSWAVVKMSSLGHAKDLYIDDATSWDYYKILSHCPQ